MRTIYPKIIRGYKAAPHKIVRNIDGEWYESRPTKEIWPAGSDVPDINGEYYGGYDCAYRWFPIGKDYPKGEWYEIKHNLYGWEMDFKPGQKPLSAYYWHTGEPEPTFHEYKHVDGIIKHVKTTYKNYPFRRSEKMKIDEFIEKVNERDGMRAKKTAEGIVMGTPNNIGIFNIPEDATNFIEIDTWATSNSLYWKKPDREYLSALIEEFLHTPIKERFSEKKYRLRWIDEEDGDRNYLVITSGWYLTNIIDDKKAVFTESELEQLKRDAPRLAPAIDVMKEPVEDD